MAISCDFYYNDILKVARKLHDLKPDFVFDEKTEDKICEQWFQLLAIHIIKNYIQVKEKSIMKTTQIINLISK